MQANAKRWFKKIRIWTLRLILGFLVTSIIIVFLLRFINPTTTFTMLSREWSDSRENFKINKNWMPIEAISKHMQLAVICGEDQHFQQHFGFDIDAIKAAVASNKRGGKVRGASTISQQTAKNVFLWEGRSWLRKGLEAWFTLLIEILWGKERIMEVYLNIAETGDGYFGVDAAATHLFKVNAAKLTMYQSAAIASILPNPRKWRIGFFPAAQRQNLIVYAMTRYGITLDYLH